MAINVTIAVDEEVPQNPNFSLFLGLMKLEVGRVYEVYRPR